MADGTLPATRRQRKSIGGLVSSRKSADKENATVDLGSDLAANRKKSRSKSMGPGGLDVLKNGNGNRRASLAAPARPAPRSILKPTIAPLPEIPPLKKRASESSRGSTQSDVTRDTSEGSKIALRTEEEQAAAAKEREERDRRDARRKSLANRRVSFAAEATLHTFQIEYLPDSTTSTDSTRRASSTAGFSSETPNQNFPGTPANNTGYADDDEDDDDFDQDATATQSGRRRRSSGHSGHSFGQNDDSTLASSIYSSDSEPADAVEEIQEEEDSGSSSDTDSSMDGTMVTVEDHEVTGASVMSAMSGRSENDYGDNDTLEQALRMAARTAATQRLDEGDDDSDGEQVIPSFGWIKKKPAKSAESDIAQHDQENQPMSRDNTAHTGELTGMDMSMDLSVPAGGIMQPSHNDNEEEGQDMTMEVTHALGGILSQNKNQDTQDDDGGETMQMDETMELTKAIGGIRQPALIEREEDDEENEDMSMELTTALGGMVPSQARKSLMASRRSLASVAGNAMEDATMDMDMTIGVGRILAGAANSNAQDDVTAGMDITLGVGRIISAADEDADADATMGMDMTTPVGRIIDVSSPATTRHEGRKALTQEVNEPDVPSRTLTNLSRPDSEVEDMLSFSDPPAPNDENNPFAGKSLRRSMAPDTHSSPQSSPFRASPSPQKSAPPRTRSRSSSPIKTGPPKQPVSPRKSSSPAKNTSPTRRSCSPSKTPTGRSKLPESRQATPSPQKTSRNTLDIFRNSTSGARTPTVVLTPQPRRMSGVGADKPGLGSPKVSAIFDRRTSIGESASEFVAGKAKGVAFTDAQIIEHEVDLERQEEEERENGMFSPYRNNATSTEKDTTSSLKDMIQSMSPKKKDFRGRKSLHVGSASGLLGKRPAELDDDDDDDSEYGDGVKRLKGHEGSPVKNIRLQQPPSKAETTGRRATRSTSQDVGDSDAGDFTPARHSSPRKTGASPRGYQAQQHDETTTDLLNPSRGLTRADRSGSGDVDDDDEDRVHLQDFLNMTSIRFMELTTTKRRHTQAPGSFGDGLLNGEENFSLERRVVAGASTIPMLELYQHSCRELKKYISEGRRIVREIETETFEENPPLFREYMTATPEIKNVLDNQFKNVKTHARFESKAMWYQWRMALQEGLREGLVKISEGMVGDEKLLKQQQKLLASVVPEAKKRFDSLTEERDNLEAVEQELADSDPAELEAARSELGKVETDIEKKTRKIAELRRQLEQTDEDIEQLTTRKQECQSDIEEAEKVREDCRGWSTVEISALKARVDALEAKHGWAITGVEATTLTMTYRRDIELTFDVAAFQQKSTPNQRIDLRYIAADREKRPQPLTKSKEYFVRCIREHVQAVPQSRTKISDFLRVVSAAWDLALSTCNDIRHLNLTFPTKMVEEASDDSLRVSSSLLLTPLETKVEVCLSIQCSNTPDAIHFTMHPTAKVVYGEHFNVGKMEEFLATHLGGETLKGMSGSQAWSGIVLELHGRLLARGRKT